ncbi:MAG: type II secretion system protein [Candidatus Ratteibacteria bacterium]
MKKGITIIEIIFVLSFIGILYTIVMPLVNRVRNDLRYKATEKEMENMVYAIIGDFEIKEKGNSYFSDTGQLPGSLNDLINNPGIPGWNGPYLKDVGDFKDGWGNDYIYNNTSGYIRSKGEDGIEGTSDDLTKYIYQPISNLTNNSIRVYVYDGQGNNLTNTYLNVQIKYPFSNWTNLNYQDGYFYLNNVPYGISHKIRTSIFDSTISDTIEEYISVYPKGASIIQKFVLKLKGAIGEEI